MYNEETKATVGAQFHCANAMRSITVSTSRSLTALPQGFGKAGLLLATCLLYLATAPTALADNECGVDDPTINGALADSYGCPDPDYPEGVTYAADGDLTVNFTNGGVTTIGENPDNGGDDPEPGDDLTDRGGIDLSATGGDSIIFDSATAGTEIESNGVLGALLSVTTVDGSIDVDAAQVDADESAAGVTHGIYAESTGSGSIDINTTGNVDANGSNPANSIGIEAVTDTGDIDLTVESGVVNGNLYAVRLETGESATATVNIVDGSVGQGGGVVAIRATGGTLILNNDDILRGSLDFSGLEGGYTFNHNAGSLWRDLGGASNLGAGVFNNAGTIDFRQGDVIAASGTAYTSDGGVFEMTAALNQGGDQLSCAAVGVSGCLDLTGGSTAGETTILVNASVDRPVSAGIVLVDVGGGTSAADHFVLDPGSDNYAVDPIYGAVLDTGGLADYTLLYNPNNQQHVLTSVPQHEALEYAAMIHESLSVWHTTSDAVAGRQADLRDGGQRGGWIRAFTGQTERNFTPTVTTHGNTFNYDRSYTLDTRGAVAGFDLTADDSHVLGVHLGFLATRLDHDDSQTKDETTFPSSVTFGAYGGWWNETGLTLDGTVNVNLLDIEHDVRSGLEDTKTNVITTGIRGEAGWRFPMAESFYVQPHVIAAYAYADVERLNMRDYDAKFEDEQSQRAALGVRLGGEQKLSGERYSRIKYWLTARTWEEYAEDGNVQFLTDGDPLVIEDDISEGFEEVGLGVSLTGPDENIEVFLSGSVRSGDQTDGNNVTIGARLNW